MCVQEVKKSIDFWIWYQVSILCKYTWLYLTVRLNYTDNKQQTLQDKKLFSLIEKIKRGGISSVIGDRYFMGDEKRILYKKMPTIYMVGLWVNL